MQTVVKLPGTFFSFLGGGGYVPLPFSNCMEITSYVLSFRMVVFYLVTTGWIFDISLCENPIDQSIDQYSARGGGGGG